jgi:hypothetical protein
LSFSRAVLPRDDPSRVLPLECLVVRPGCNADVLAGRELVLALEVALLEERPFLRVELRSFFSLLRLLLWRLRGGPSESSSRRAVFLVAVASFERLDR